MSAAPFAPAHSPFAESPAVREAAALARTGERLDRAAAETLYYGASLHTLAALAHAMRLRLHPEPVVTYVGDRNINYSNVCVCACRFCAFFRAPGDPEGYVISREDMAQKIDETLRLGGTQILLQGGHHPDLPLEWYEDLLRWLRERWPGLHIHAFSPPEIFFWSRRFGLPVPEVLRSGDHARIARWRREESLRATLLRRPDLLDEAPLTRDDASFLAGLPRERAGRNLSFCLLHHPVMLDAKNSGTSSLTNLDIHDIARISRSYAMGPFFAVTPLADQRELLRAILGHWTDEQGRKHLSDRARALDMVRPAASLDEALALREAECGVRPVLLTTSAVWPGKKCRVPLLTPRAVRDMCRRGPVMLCLGTARGLAPEVLARSDGMLRPVRFLSDNHLSVRSAAAILADRILGDYD